MLLKPTKSRIGLDNIGYCFDIADTEFAFIPIPKNASSYTEDILKIVSNLKEDNFISNEDIKNKKLIIVLRDPLERWFSGIVQHFFLGMSKPVADLDDGNMLKYVFQQLCLDSHSELQINFLPNIDTKKCIFVRMTNDYSMWFKKIMLKEMKINYTFWGKDIDENTLRYNHSTDNAIKIKYISVLKEFYKNNKFAQKNLREYLEPDYKLFSNIVFYDSKLSGI